MPRTEKRVGYIQCMGSHRGGHSWSDLACTHVWSLVTGWAGVWAVGATPLGSFHPLPSVPRECTPQGWRPRSCSFPLSLQRVCTLTDALAGALATRELVSLPPECVHHSMYWLPPPQSEVGPGPSWLRPLKVCTPARAMAAPALVGRSSRARGAGTGGQWGPGDTGVILVSRQEQQAAFNPLPLCCDWKQACVCGVFKSSLSQSSSHPHWFSVRGLSKPVSEPKGWGT